MSTPILNPNSPLSTNTNTNSTSSYSQIHIELSKILRKHDPSAIRLYDFINHVKVFRYDSNEYQWENNASIEGSLLAYERQQIINNQIYPSYAFAIINGEQKLIQQITLNMVEHADKLRLFYEVVRDDKPEVFCLHFLNENECLRLHTFINRSIQSIRNVKEQQSRTTTTSELQLTQMNEQVIRENVHRQQIPINMPNVITSQFGLSRQTPTHLTSQRSTPVINDNNSIADPTSSLKRLLNIPSQNDLDNGSVFSQQQQQNSINLLPPSAFETKPVTSSSSIGTEHNKHHLSQIYPLINREHFRNVLLHLVQNNDQFLDIIYQACFTYPSSQ